MSRSYSRNPFQPKRGQHAYKHSGHKTRVGRGCLTCRQHIGAGNSPDKWPHSDLKRLSAADAALLEG